MSKHTLSVLVENKPGVLARITALFSRRGFNIDSLAVGVTEHPEISRITIVVNVIEEANSINDRPVVVDFIVHEDAMVWPMVAAGTSNDEVMFARDVRPDFGDNEDD